VRGRQPQGVIGADTMAEKLRGMGEKRQVKAVVLRINSPGGDAFAAEKVRREVQALREAGKTVVVSMGNVAASGGYWIAMGAEEVWASPSTITGSIGVFGILPTFQKPLAKMGIHSDGVGTTQMAGKMRLDRELDPDLERVFQYATERTYEDFINLVAEARPHLDADGVHEVAQGRVWSGAQAQDHQLVDATGTLEQAIDAAARIAGLGAEYDVVYDEWELSPFEAMLLEMFGSAAAHFELGVPGAHSQLANSLLGKILEDLQILLLAGGDGLTIAAHCLCDID
jgi:protease-4